MSFPKPPLLHGLTCCGLAVLIMLAAGGCREPGYETVQGANERIKAQQREIEDLKQQIRDLKIERDQDKTQIADRWRTLLADEEKKVSELRMQMASIERERQALQDVVQSGPRAEMARGDRFVMERIIYLVLVLVSLMLSAFMAVKWKRTHDRLQHLVMSEVADVRRLEAR